MHADRGFTVKLTLCLATVYLVWGSTFLVTKIAVAHLPIALFSAVRFLSAGTILASVARFGRRDAWPQRRIDWRHAAITGFFMVFANNGLNAWAIQYLATNQAALLNGTAAFWIAGLGVFGRRGHPLTRRAIIGLVIGFAGTAFMLTPQGMPRAQSLLAQAGALGACLAFSLGTLYYRNAQTPISPLMFMAMQLWCGGLMLLAIALMHGDLARWTFNTPGILSVSYLTLVSSCLAFSAYGWLTRNCTPALIGTYSYVNPAVAAFLGWELLNERLWYPQLIGMLIIVIGVFLLTLPGSSLTDRRTLAEPRTQ